MSDSQRDPKLRALCILHMQLKGKARAMSLPHVSHSCVISWECLARELNSKPAEVAPALQTKWTKRDSKVHLHSRAIARGLQPHPQNRSSVSMGID